VLKHAEASALASVLNQHFGGLSEVVAAPVGSGNILLISGTTESIGEVTKLLDQLDRKARTVEVEVIIAETATKKGADAKEVEVSGLEPLARLEVMNKAGQLGTIQRIKLTAVEGQPITSTTAGSKPYVSGAVMAAAGGGGFGGDGPGAAPGGRRPGEGGAGGAAGLGGPGRMMQRSIAYHESGTTIKFTARIGAGDLITLDLSVQDSKIRPGEAGEEISAASFDHNTLNTKLSIPSGKAVSAQSFRADGKSSGTVSLVIVAARVMEPEASKNK
jgi:hypothetical protein